MNCHSRSFAKKRFDWSWFVLGKCFKYAIWGCIIISLVAVVNIFFLKKQDIILKMSHQTIRKGDTARLKILLNQYPGLIREVSAQGADLLHVACRTGQPDIVRFLKQKGFCLESRTCSGLTPLHYAVGEGHPEIVRFLLKEGVDVNVPDYRGFLRSIEFARKNTNIFCRCCWKTAQI